MNLTKKCILKEKRTGNKVKKSSLHYCLYNFIVSLRWSLHIKYLELFYFLKDFMSKKRELTNTDISDMMDIDSHFIPLSYPDDELLESGDVPEIIPILTLRSSVLFPGAITPVTIGRDKSIKLIKEMEGSGKIFGAVLQKNASVEEPTKDDLYKIGTLARLLKVLEMPNGNLTAILHGVEKFEVTEYCSSEPYFTAKIATLADKPTSPKDELKFEALVESIKDISINLINLSTSIPRETIFAIKNLNNSRGIINFVSTNLDFSDEDRQALLEAPGLYSRATKLLELLVKDQQLAKIKNDLQSKVKLEIDSQQREYFLQQQLRTIQEELGGDITENEIEELREKSLTKKWSSEVSEIFGKEIAKLERMNPAVAEYSIQMNYLNLMLDLPWESGTKDNFNLKNAQKHLDNDHFGLDEVKDRIIEHLSVLKLKGDLKSPIICLYGPPGVGKTSLGKSVANALNRKYGRISLGGLHDESEIRGHRRTYIGAMPGRILQTIKKCGSNNPVIILDEIDKVSRSNHGDPSSALLEVLDPEQNTTFHDNYLDIEYDLSKVLFIATANNVGDISTALKDRMEMINVSGYLQEEKLQIAKKHLLPKELMLHGVKSSQLKLSDDIINKIISEYTRESGVRALDKKIAKIVRHRAKQIGMEETFKVNIPVSEVEKTLGIAHFKYDMYEGNDNIGVVTGLAWTQVGGDILYIESSSCDGKGTLTLTGNLGDVMKESATIALQWVKANASSLNIDSDIFTKKDFHIHVPEGATPKDGPSAGITIVTSLVSMLTSSKVKERIAMTGEITLRGKVLPVGGIKEKILAAKRSGLKEIILSEDNRRDILEIKKEYLDGLTFHYIANINEVIKLALNK